MCFTCKKYKGEIKKLKNNVYELEEQNAFIQELYEGEKAEKEKCWKAYDACKKELEECGEGEDSSPKPITSLTIKNGKFCVNNKITDLQGLFKREGFAVGSGDRSSSDLNYKYSQLKSAVRKCKKCNYIRFIIPKDLAWTRREIKEWIELGYVCQGELDHNNEYPYEADWKEAYECLKDLPMLFEAHNEYLNDDYVNNTIEVIDYVSNRGGLIGAGAWGLSQHGEVLSQKLKNLAGHKVSYWTHHQRHTKESIEANRIPGKPIDFNELYTKGYNVNQVKSLMRMAKNTADSFQVYSLMNFGIGLGSGFQALLDYFDVL
ncbi:MAG: hypothetical protein ACOC5G_04140 [Acidobacteriota bacterium]